ncbi:MAG: DUF4405 domain-containing protein [Lachnospiraceae bacterium]|nr:DUF4405 domain-containing protein [Lachnospiraceae bacterium]MDD3616705.1 DUF4405 domain-containing protein [Lachnospiraceae bacterium]NCB93672.1 DUF4405 domain-containing protein [Clostridia bacterium]
MNTKLKIKITVDILMTIAMFVTMCYPYTGGDYHEVAGTVLLVLIILHQILNRNWYKNLMNGSFSGPRILQTIVDIGMLVVLFLQMFSGISMSGYVFTFLPFGMNVGLARTIHLVCAYISFLLMSFHVGLHYGMIINMFRKMFHIKETNKTRTTVLRVIAMGIAIYGVIALVKRDFLEYIMMQTHFAFFDFEEPVLIFVIDYIAIMEMMVFVAYYLQKWLIEKTKQEITKKEKTK